MTPKLFSELGLSADVPCNDQGCTVAATTTVMSTHTHFDDPLHEIGLGAATVDVGATRIENAITVHYALSDTTSIAPTVRAATEQLTINPNQGAFLNTHRTSSRAAVQFTWEVWERVFLRAMVSGQCDGTTLAGATPWTLPGSSRGDVGGSAVCNQVYPAARLGIEWTTSSWTILANAGRYVRVPTLSELYGISGAVRGNMSLTAETGVSTEMGARWAGRHGSALAGASLDAFAFVRWADNLIAYQRAPNYAIPYNVGGARVVGAELQASYHIGAAARVELAATLRDPRDTSRTNVRNDLLPYVPRLILAPRVELTAPLGHHLVETGKLAAAYFYESSYYGDPAGLLTIPSQGSLDIESELDFLCEHLALRVRAANVLDQTRFDLIGYPLPGRSLYIAMESKW